jgi:hypothetical protein
MSAADRKQLLKDIRAIVREELAESRRKEINQRLYGDERGYSVGNGVLDR